MKWMKERDLLIAQTMAFVQSVKGKLPDAELPAPAPRTATATAPAVQPAATPPSATPAPAAALPIAAEQALAEAVATLSVKAEVRAAVVPPPLPAPTVIEGLPPAPSPLAVTVVEIPPQPAQLPHFARLDISGDFGSEVRERVANFRAQQQRFLKEREEYCTTTMAKVRAAINELPRSGK
ncbi:hypothetical protein ACVIHI_003477 [Bradyrhizobium sp. USDA 4524]|uniref:hypothetical protein n=1 Tax=unclassified Bradyrhizobium TaxID=2631580 RepID=UPI0020A04501|nr:MULTISPECIES: hypothetical protein [unclassified Bradyrhizobium]MCP1843605.1 hypothetical protein [Bradyrhizobium sp. USDA 4538]MCP1904171.1 hypothetical protein [Bradyrhizobium sp. USDA 4537]MCP1990173.1 hypothetical protein [Bradyrhizobium sp. USDA 4539]